MLKQEIMSDHSSSTLPQNPVSRLLTIHLIDVGRSLAIFIALGLLIIFLAGGLSQLYVDWNAFEKDDIGSLLPSLQGIRDEWEIHQDTLLEQHIPATLWVTVTGLSMAIALGLFLAAMMDLVPLARWILYPLLIISQTIPIFAVAVILILLFGFEFGPKIIVVTLFCFFPITINTLSGFQSVNPLHTSLLRSLGANPLQLWWKVRLPTALPSFFSGLRIAATYSVVGAVIGEYVGAGDGLGKFLQRSYRSFASDQVFLAVVIIAVLSMLFVVLTTLIELLVLRWRYAGRQSYREGLFSRASRFFKTTPAFARPKTQKRASSPPIETKPEPHTKGIN
jgi:ABC-type nitrate/sulfonate/bicarbonate transport system permease component